MGFRTVIIINNDRLHELQQPDFGKDLESAICGWWGGPKGRQSYHPSFNIIEQCHADQVTLMKLDSLQGTPMAYGTWNQRDLDVSLLKDAADKLGYKLIKKSKKAR